MVSTVEVLGLTAGFLIAASLVPQILRVWKLRDAQDISLTFNLLNLGGTVLWLYYGMLQGLLAIVVWNGVNTGLMMALLGMKLKYGMGRGSPVVLRPPS